MGTPPDPPQPKKPAPPVRETAQDVAYAKEEQRRKQAARMGYQSTLQPKRSGTALSSSPVMALPKKTALG